MNNIHLKTNLNVELHPSTKVFEGRDYETKLKAKKYAEENCSYIMDVFEDIRCEGKSATIIHGYGIPK